MPALDGVRGLAIAMVLALHFVANTDETNAFERALDRVFAFGEFGVDLFFVLSGFLITGILFDAKGQGAYFSRFYSRRALRIFPLYYAVLALVFFVAPLVPALRGSTLDYLRAEQAWAWLYGVNVFTAVQGSFRLSYLDHFWSLAVEEHFYFFWPLVVWACERRTLVVVSSAIAILSFGARAACAEAHVSPVALYALTPFRLDALCMGAVLALVARGPRGVDAVTRAALPIGLAAAGLIVATYAFNTQHHVLWEPMHELRKSSFSVVFAAVVARALSPRGTAFDRALSWRPGRLLGKYSYGLYVFHHFVSTYMIRNHTEWWLTGHVGSHTLAVLVQAAVGISISIAVSVASFHFFESRVLAFRHRWRVTRAEK